MFNAVRTVGMLCLLQQVTSCTGWCRASLNNDTGTLYGVWWRFRADQPIRCQCRVQHTETTSLTPRTVQLFYCEQCFTKCRLEACEGCRWWEWSGVYMQLLSAENLHQPSHRIQRSLKYIWNLTNRRRRCVTSLWKAASFIWFCVRFVPVSQTVWLNIFWAGVGWRVRGGSCLLTLYMCTLHIELVLRRLHNRQFYTSFCFFISISTTPLCL